MAEPAAGAAPAEPAIRSAGAVVWRGDPRDPEIVLIHRPRYDDWSFPKGKLLPGEHRVTAALREVAEETGLRVVLGRPLPPARYLVDGLPKQVDYWVARVAEDAPHLPSDEVDRIEWVPVAEAATRLRLDWDRATLDRLRAAPLDTWPMAVVRHARAGSREKWSGDDDLRPLDDRGRAQAAAIAGVLAGYRPRSLVSSPSLRCVQTLTPYAARHGLGVRTERVYTETEYEPDAALDLTLSLLDAGGPAALCGHGKVLPDLVAGVLRERAGDGEAEFHLPKGGVAVLHHAAGRVVAVERHLT
ncbi:ADP-ribose pyrophosphatase [Sphaerisporangium rufum]|uniref:ADP-ribose pyrophosphatase n=1 Tax=Sphaerisporangium rufum TaxID=1381558 RepID=A0A919R189_9ACTN|nr:NUDIX domain-containing protein [Sphaerisporangium rufum]GII77904.1 ADP-ribose pyrophosphatase [Sphaerisporangium rufum]